MADEKVESLKVNIGGTDMNVPSDSKLFKQLVNLQEAQRETLFSDERAKLVSMVVDVVEDLDDDKVSPEALEGMCLVYPFVDDEKPQLVAFSKVSIAKRKGRQAATDED